MSKEKGQAMIGSASEDTFKDLQYQRLNNPKKKNCGLTPSFASPLVLPSGHSDQRRQVVKREPKGEDVRISHNIRSVSRRVIGCPAERVQESERQKIVDKVFAGSA